MFSFQEYLLGWSIYLVSVLGLLLIAWHITRPIPWLYIQQPLRLVLATFLLLPTTVENAPLHLAPAWIKGLLQLVFGDMEGFLPVGRYLLLAVLLALLLYFLLAIGLFIYQRQVSDRSS